MSKAVPKEEKTAPALTSALRCNPFISCKEDFITFDPGDTGTFGGKYQQGVQLYLAMLS
jgi:hypothetical protein